VRNGVPERNKKLRCSVYRAGGSDTFFQNFPLFSLCLCLTASSLQHGHSLPCGCVIHYTHCSLI
jgi:hypothetical protein